MSEHRDAEAGGKVQWANGPLGARLLIGLAVVCALLTFADLFIHKHGPFAIEHMLGFYGWLGLVASVVVVVLARAVRAVLMRPEDYYDR
jgi:uncharacterized membrane protein